jgi:hypothetical protein
MKKNNKFWVVPAFLVVSLFFISMVDTRDTLQISLQNSNDTTNDDIIAESRDINESYMFLAGIGKEDNYIPEMKLLVSIDKGESWSENTKNLKMGQPFYLMFEASCRIPGLRLQMFGAKSIVSYITIPKETIISFEIDDSDTNHRLFARDPDDPEDYDLILFTIPTSPLGANAVASGAQPSKVVMILKCTPKKRGSQKIFVEYEDKVDSSYTKTYTLEIN